MSDLSAAQIDTLEWLKRAEPSEVRESLEESWEDTLEFSDSYAAVEQFSAEEPYYDEVTLGNPERDADVLDFLQNTSAETLFELLSANRAEPEGESVYLQITKFIDATH
jgi:hypothetical protein